MKDKAKQQPVEEIDMLRNEVESAGLDNEERYRLMAAHAADVMWTVDMNMRPTYISPSITRLLGYSVQEAMAEPMEEVFSPASFKLAMQALEEELGLATTKQKGLDRSRALELELIHKNGSIVPVEVAYAFLLDVEARPVEVLAIARDISQRKRAQDEAKHSTGRLIKAVEQTIQAMAIIVELRDPYTAGHQQRVTQLACAIAKQMGLPEKQIIGIRLAGLIHDIGKVRVPAEILANPDGLSEPELTMIKAHPLIGYEILKSIDFRWPVAQIVLQHHERMNGSGYPSGLSGKDIIVEARILAISDVVEAMASHRPYRAALGINKALDEISQNKGVLYDSKAADACLMLFRDHKFEFEQDTKKASSFDGIYRAALQS